MLTEGGKVHIMKRIYLLAVVVATLLVTSCDMESSDAKKDHAAQAVTDFYMHIKNHEFDSAMYCTNLDPKSAEQMGSLFSLMDMEIHEFRVDSVALGNDDTTATVHIALRVSNAFAPDTVETTPSIPCVKTRGIWLVRFDCL